MARHGIEAERPREAPPAESHGVPVFGLGEHSQAVRSGAPRWVEVLGVRPGRTPYYPGPVVDLAGYVSDGTGFRAVVREELFLRGTTASPVFDEEARRGLPLAVAFVAQQVTRVPVPRADEVA